MTNNPNTPKIKKPRAPNKQGNSKLAGAAHSTIKKYDHMWEAYKEKQTIQNVAEKCHVSHGVARRAVREGWPRLKLEGLADRWVVLQQRTERDMGTSGQMRIGETLRTFDDFIRLTDEVLQQVRTIDLPKVFTLDAMKKLGPREAVTTLDRLASVMERVVKMNELLRGRPTSRADIHHEVDVTPAIHRIRNMDDTELDGIIARARADDVAQDTTQAIDAYAKDLLARYEPRVPLLPAGVSRETPVAENPQ